MCVVAVANIPGYGWVGVKNRDRNYIANIELTKSNRKDIERLYIDDKLSRWTEGINEHGVGILSSSFSVKYDEKEGDKAEESSQDGKKRRGDPGYYSKDGFSIRNALLLKNPKEAVQYLAQRKLAGATYVFNENQCWLLEGGFDRKGKERKYFSTIKQITGDYSVRTNHGVSNPDFGYQKNTENPKMDMARKSSLIRRQRVLKQLEKNAPFTPKDVLDCVSHKIDKDPFLNPIRSGNPKKKEMFTTGQLLLIPKTKTLCYRPIVCKLSFDYQKLNNSKTNFEIISDRKLLSFSEFSRKTL